MARQVVEEVVVEYTGNTKGIQRASKNATKAINDVGTKAQVATKKASTGFQAMGRNIGIAAAALAAFKVVKIADEFTLLKARIDGSTESLEESTKAWAGLKDISKDTGADLGAAVDVFQRLSFVRTEIGATVNDMLQFTETVSQLGIVSGASTTALRSGLTQLGQGLSSGVLRAEEFNSILENIPAVGKAIAEEFGVTTGQLRNLVIDGKVLSQDVFQAILNQSEKVRAEFEKFPTTVGRAFANLKIRLGEAIGGINEATGATSGLIQAMEIAGQTITMVANLIKGFAGSINATFTIIVTAITAAVVKATQNIEDLVNVGIDALNKFRSEANQLERASFAPRVELKFLAAEGIKQAQKEVAAGFKGFETAFETGAGIFGVEFNENIDKTASKVVDLGDKYSKMGTSAKDGSKEAEKAMKKLQDQTRKNRTEMADFVFDSMRGFDALRETALEFLNDIARNIMRASFGGNADTGLAGQIGGGIGSLFGNFGNVANTASLSTRSFASVAASAGGGAFGPGFATGGSFTVGGNLDLDGESGDLLDMAEDTIAWTLDVTGTADANYVNAAYSNAAGGTAITAHRTCVNSNNNSNWSLITTSSDDCP